MKRITHYLPIAGNNIRRWSTNPRLYILAILLLILMWSYIDPILQFSKAMGYRVAPWIFPFLTNFPMTQRLLMLGIVFLFCDAPFAHEGQPYLMIRSGRMHWASGQVLYIMAGTAIYLLFIIFASMLLLAPSMYLNTGWGKILGTLAQTNAGQSFHIQLPISYKIQVLYEPVQALGLSFFLEWCAGVILGLAMFITNLFFKRALGAIVASAIILLDIFIPYNITDYAYHFSPISLARLGLLDSSGMSLYPTPAYACTFLTVTVVGLSIIAILSVRKREIQISPPI